MPSWLTKCPRCNGDIVLVTEAGLPTQTTCDGCGVTLGWDGDCHVTWTSTWPPPTPSGQVKPFLVQFYRCGMASRGKGWRKCSTPDLCSEAGCQR